jgi:hypothetical protein
MRDHVFHLMMNKSHRKDEGMFVGCAIGGKSGNEETVYTGKGGASSRVRRGERASRAARAEPRWRIGNCSTRHASALHLETRSFNVMNVPSP